MNNIQYKYSKMDLGQFAMFEENYSIEIKEVEFNTNTMFSYDSENRTLACKISVVSSQKEKPLFKIEVNSYFELSPDSIESLKKENEISFPPNILIQFASFCYGATRGVVFTKTIGTSLNNLILPPVYFNNIIDKGFAVNISNEH